MHRARSWTSLVAAVAAGVVLALAAASPAGAAGGGCVPGAPGLGDRYFPTYGNGGYDVRRYELEVAYDPATDRIDGEAEIALTATQRLCSLNFDLVGLEVHAIEVNGRAATWTRDGQELTVTPRRPLEPGRRTEVEVRYAGVPAEFAIPGLPIRTGFMATPDGATVAGQPQVASGWFPVNDHPLDKAAYRFEVTVPEGVEVVANGFLRGVRTEGGRTTWTWEAREPMASYLATIDIGQWDVRQWRTASGLPVYDAVDSAITGGLRAAIDSSLARQGEVLDVLSAAFGPYPFSTIGAIVDNQDDFFFALETQTRPVYSKYFWLDPQGNPENGDSVVVHEIAHQWFGDSVAVARWRDIWLNEGFATYAEWLWTEHEGEATTAETFRATYDAIPADDVFWTATIGDPGVERLFDDAVYVRGAMTLQALREEVGDESFWAIVRGWTAAKRGGNATTEEFIAFAEQVAGRELDALFTTWLFTPSKPALAPLRGDALRTESAAAWLDELRRRLARGRY